SSSITCRRADNDDRSALSCQLGLSKWEGLGKRRAPDDRRPRGVVITLNLRMTGGQLGTAALRSFTDWRLSYCAEFCFRLELSRYDLTDFEWRVIRPLVPNKRRGIPRVDDRRVLNGIF